MIQKKTPMLFIYFNNIITMLPYPQAEGISSFQPAWAEGPAELPAAELAVDHINHDSVSNMHVAWLHREADKHLIMVAVM